MTLQFFDGFDHYTSAGDFAIKWDTVSGPSISSTHVHGSSGGAARFTSNTSYCRKMGLGAHATYVAAGWFYIVSYPVDMNILTFWESTSQAQGMIRLGTTPFLGVYRGNEVTQLGSFANVTMPTGTWHFVEAKWVTDASVGSVQVKLNGITVINLTNQNTKGGSTTNINGVGIGSPYPGGAGGDVYVDEFYGLNGAGSANNDFIGPRYVGTLYATAIGSQTALTPNGSANNYSCVNETAEDGDATYVSGATPGLIDSYLFSSLPGAATSVSGIQYNLWARKDDALNTRAVSPLQRYSSSNALGTASGDLPTTYTDIRSLYETSLVNAGQPWTVLEVNNSEIGLEVTT